MNSCAYKRGGVKNVWTPLGGQHFINHSGGGGQRFFRHLTELLDSLPIIKKYA